MSTDVVNPINLAPAGEVRSRFNRLQQALIARDLPLALVTHRVDLYYLTGSMPNGTLVCPAQGEPVFFVRKSVARTKAESPLADVRPAWGSKPVVEYLLEALGEQPLRVGIDLDVLAANTYSKFVAALPTVRWVDSGAILRQVRAVKSPWEIARLAEAAEQVEAAFAAARGAMREGVSELELSILVESTMRRMGHSGVVRLRRPGQELVVAHVSAGRSAAAATAFDGPVGAEGLHPAGSGGAGTNVLARGVPVMLDLLGISQGYTADIARTFCLGDPPDEIKRAHDFCREALQRIESLLTPGTPCGEVYAQVDKWAKQQGEPTGFMGYGENRVRFFGHGVGLEVDELPVLAAGFDAPLEVGNMIAVEPKAFHPALGPAGLENTYVIEENGARSLCGWPEEIEVI